MADIGVGQPTDGYAYPSDINLDRIVPGENISYYACKWLWLFHPLANKIVEKPIKMALSLPRLYLVDNDPDGRVTRQFTDTWNALNATKKIAELFFVSRCYGAAAMGIGSTKIPSEQPLDNLFELDPGDLYINIFDPLNTSGSVVTSQDPNTRNFQAADEFLYITGSYWHPSRTTVVFNGTPIYLAYQPSTYGYTGQSVFQRIFTPMKSYLNTINTDDMISKKAGILVAKTQQNGSVITGTMEKSGFIKRMFLKIGRVGQILQIGHEDAIESLDLGNLSVSYGMARDNIIANIAAGSDVPAILLKEESFTHGFGEGTEDAKAIAHYIDLIRQELYPVVKYIENLVFYLSWTRDFYEIMKSNYPSSFPDDYLTTFYKWKDSFDSRWQPLIETSPEKQQESDARKIERAAQVVQVMAAGSDPVNRAAEIAWLAEVASNTDSYKDTPLYLDLDLLEQYNPSQEEMEQSGGPRVGQDKFLTDPQKLSEQGRSNDGQETQ